MCTHQVAALFCVNDAMAAVLNLWRHIRNPIPPINAYFFTLRTIPAKFHPDPI